MRVRRGNSDRTVGGDDSEQQQDDATHPPSIAQSLARSAVKARHFAERSRTASRRAPSGPAARRRARGRPVARVHAASRGESP
jgi:hypothetical protein